MTLAASKGCYHKARPAARGTIAAALTHAGVKHLFSAFSASIRRKGRRKAEDDSLGGVHQKMRLS